MYSSEPSDSQAFLAFLGEVRVENWLR
jgi:hypothetical protein